MAVLVPHSVWREYLVNKIYQLLFSCALVHLTPCAAQDSVALSDLKAAIGRQSVNIHLATGENFSDRLHKVDASARILIFGSRRQPRAVSCLAIGSLEFEPKARRRKRHRAYSAIANLTILPVVLISVTPSLGATAPLLLLWPGSVAWGWPVSKSMVKRETQAFQVNCQ